MLCAIIIPSSAHDQKGSSMRRRTLGVTWSRRKAPKTANIQEAKNISRTILPVLPRATRPAATPALIATSSMLARRRRKRLGESRMSRMKVSRESTARMMASMMAGGACRMPACGLLLLLHSARLHMPMATRLFSTAQAPTAFTNGSWRVTARSMALPMPPKSHIQSTAKFLPVSPEKASTQRKTQSTQKPQTTGMCSRMAHSRYHDHSATKPHARCFWSVPSSSDTVMPQRKWQDSCEKSFARRQTMRRPSCTWARRSRSSCCVPTPAAARADMIMALSACTVA
mmetsp:Transcript_83436/g.244629  ORF Transcript_83436/g.244629 Transcript_83436/m.244629 type:complete len:285 (-) Transcript_83436:992-1846(-)